QPFHRDEGGHRRGDEGHAQRAPVLLRRGRGADHAEQLVAAGGEHGRDADQEREFGRRRARGGAGQQSDEDRRRRTRGAREHAGHDLGDADQRRHRPGDVAALAERGRALGREMLGRDHPHAAQHQRPGDRGDVVGQGEAGLLDDDAEHRGDAEGHAELEQVIEVVALGEADGQAPPSASSRSPPPPGSRRPGSRC
ncbi:hypothetical protein CATMIT_01835, partial [Catenibacterium mitsuokai DSM 15897]